jgi:hypothetical protein
MHEPRHLGVTVLAERVVGLAPRMHELVEHRHVSAPQGLRGIRPAHQARVVRGDPDRQRPAVALHRRALAIGEDEDPLQTGEVTDAVADLPAPVVPVARVGLGEERAPELL